MPLVRWPTPQEKESTNENEPIITGFCSRGVVLVGAGGGPMEEEMFRPIGCITMFEGGAEGATTASSSEAMEWGCQGWA